MFKIRPEVGFHPRIPCRKVELGPAQRIGVNLTKKRRFLAVGSSLASDRFTGIDPRLIARKRASYIGTRLNLTRNAITDRVYSFWKSAET